MKRKMKIPKTKGEEKRNIVDSQEFALAISAPAVEMDDVDAHWISRATDN